VGDGASRTPHSTDRQAAPVRDGAYSFMLGRPLSLVSLRDSGRRTEIPGALCREDMTGWNESADDFMEEEWDYTGDDEIDRDTGKKGQNVRGHPAATCSLAPLPAAPHPVSLRHDAGASCTAPPSS
jgi:hypothetical protein